MPLKHWIVNYADTQNNMANESENHDENNDPFSHWGNLAEELGAEIPPEPEQPEPASPEESEPVSHGMTEDQTGAAEVVAEHPTAADEPAEEEPAPAEKPAPSKPASRSHWSHLASLLGLGSSKSIAEEDEEEEVEEEDDVAEPQDENDDENADIAEETVTARVVDSPLPSEQDDPPAEQYENIFAGFGQPDADDAPAPTTMFADESNSAAGLLGGFTDDATDEKQKESTDVLSTMFTPTPASFWEEVEAEDEADQVETEIVDQDDAEQENEVRFESRSRADADDDGDQKPQGRRRRRRRRRRRGEETPVESESVLNDDDDSVLSDELGQTPSDSQLRLEASADLFDEHDLDEFEEAPQARSNDSPTDGRRGAKRIPSWLDAVGFVVQRNIDSRSPSENPSSEGRSGGGGGAGGGRRRRGKRRRRPNKQENES